MPYEDELQPIPVMPQPNRGFPTSQSLELTHYLTNPQSFIYDGDNKILEGHFPPDMLEHFWGFLIPDHVLSYLEDKDINSLMFQCKAARKLYLKRIPKGKKSLDTLYKLDQIEALILSRLKRGHHGFERQKMTEMTQQTLYGEIHQQQPRRGMIGGAMGALGSIPKTLFGGP